MAKYSFGEVRPLYPHTSRDDLVSYKTRDILIDPPEKWGHVIGTINYEERGGGEIHVGWVESFLGAEKYGGEGQGSNTLGIGAMRDLGAQLKSEGVTSVSGERVSGARAEMNYRAALADKNYTPGRTNEVKVSLTGGKNVIGGKPTSTGADEPRDDHGRWTT